MTIEFVDPIAFFMSVEMVSRVQESRRAFRSGKTKIYKFSHVKTHSPQYIDVFSPRCYAYTKKSLQNEKNINQMSFLSVLNWWFNYEHCNQQSFSLKQLVI